jgi:uncharacterized protein involved in outer membrane biogenesis
MNEIAKPNQYPRWLIVSASVLLVLIALIALGEWLGWPFLAGPLERMLSNKLDRRVTISAAAEPNASHEKFRVRFIGGLSLYAPQFEIAAPAWSTTPHLLLARNVALKLRYIDLWHAYKGQQLRVRSLQADMIDGQFERLADGRATWQLGPDPTAESTQPLPSFDQLLVKEATINYQDVPFMIDAQGRLSLLSGTSQSVSQPVASSGVAIDSATHLASSTMLQANVTGKYRNLPLKIDLKATGDSTWTSNEVHQSIPVQVNLDATIGNANLSFTGTATDALNFNGLKGDFSVKGPSLAAVGQPLGVTLPTTRAFRTNGKVSKQESTWHVVIDDATVGGSKLNGDFTYESARKIPLLTGQLNGPRLLMVDLGPAIGTAPATEDFSSVPVTTPTKQRGKILPSRPFDLASLRVMEADVLINIDSVDLNTTLLEPLRPLHTHLQLKDSVLTLSDLVTHVGDGDLKGKVSLDGRGSEALWSTHLHWEGVRLERWIHQVRKNGSPPYVTGRLNGATNLEGQGRSTAEILGSLQGHFRTELRNGSVSHLAIELAGLDLAESLGVILKGDDALPVECAVADLYATKGLFHPRLLVVDTTASTVWVDGSVSLAKESMDLRAVVSPKDFSLLALRTPLHVRGTFAEPKISLEKKPLARQLASALLLSLVNPLAAWLPLVDRGDIKTAKRDAAGCLALMQRTKGSLPATQTP